MKSAILVALTFGGVLSAQIDVRDRLSAFPEAHKPQEPVFLNLTGPIPLQATYWTDNSNNGKAGPKLAGALSFSFPVVADPRVCTNGACNTINYLTNDYWGTWANASMAGNSSITISGFVTTTGSPAFNPHNETMNGANCNDPARMRVLIWQWNGAAQDYDRWWSFGDYYTLKAGTFTLTIPLDGSHWSSVMGDRGDSPTGAQWFQQALRNVRALGVTFGGGCYYGHGVNVSGGAATLTLTGFSLQ